MRQTRRAGGVTSRVALVAAAATTVVAGVWGAAPAAAEDGYPTSAGPFADERACQQARAAHQDGQTTVSPCLYDTDGWYFGYR